MNIGFIGLGHMGAHMAHNLAKAGHTVSVFDARQQAIDDLVARSPGMRAGKSVADVATGADLVGTSLPGPNEIEAVVLGPGGLLETMKPGSIYVDHSTDSVTMVHKLATALKANGIDMLDAPVSGGERGSEAGSLSVMVGGDESIWDKAQPELQAIGGKLFYCGPTGSGAAVKLCNNAAAFGHQAVVAEVLTMGMKAGVDLKTLASVIGVSSGRSTTLTEAYPNRTFRRNFEGFGFTVALSEKDLRLAKQMGNDLGLEVALISSVHAALKEAVDMGLGQLDFNAVVQAYEKRTGTVLSLTDEEIDEIKKIFAQGR